MEGKDSGNNTFDLEECTRIGNYEIVKPIGRGKFAVVYRAKHVETNEIVALKRINVDLIDAKTRDKCLKEVKLLQSLDHPNIIKYLDSFITDNDLVIIVEWAAAGDLKRQLRKQQEKNVNFDERIIWKYFSQICEAMRHMHERRIMHRDLKPANIFLTLDGTIKVGDLGLSREMSENTMQAHSKVGTPLYMSPEVLRGDGYDFKSDIWSLGCLLYELAMLKSPFKSEGLKLYALFQKISQGDYQPLPDTYSDELRNLTYALLGTRPEERPDINYICDVARSMRAATQELYVKEKKALKRQLSNESVIITPENARITETTPSSFPIPVFDDGKGKNVQNEPKIRDDSTIEQKDTERVRNVMALDIHDSQKKGQDYDDYKEQLLNYQQQVPFCRKNYDQNKRDYDHNYPTVEEKSPSAPSKKSYEGISEPLNEKRNTRETHNIPDQSPTAMNGRSKDLNLNKDTNHAQTYVSPSSQYDKTSPAIYHRPKSRMQPSYNSPQGTNPNHRGKSTSSDDRIAERQTESAKDHEYNTPLSWQNSKSKLQDNDQNNDSSSGIDGAIPLMDILYTKLTLLGYTQYDRSFLPMQFAMDISSLKSIAGLPSIASNSSYRKFVIIAKWLIEKIDSNPNTIKKINSIQLDKDSPVMVAKVLLSLAQDVGADPNDIVDITPSALSTGYGEKVCSYLLCLASVAIQKLNFKLSPTRQVSDEIGSTVEDFLMEENQEDEVIDEEYALQEEEDRIQYDSSSESPSRNPDRDIIHPNVDKNLWLEELERVSSSLVREAALMRGASSGWIDHVSTISNYRGKILSQAVSNERSMETDKGSTRSVIELPSALNSLKNDVTQTLQSLTNMETVLNNKDSLRLLGRDYCMIQKNKEEMDAKISTQTHRTQALTEQLSDIVDKCDEIQDEYQRLTSDDNINSNNRIIKVREAVKACKDDIVKMDITIGMISNQLMQYRHNLMKKKLASMASKRKTSRNKHDDDDDIDGYGLEGHLIK